MRHPSAPVFKMPEGAWDTHVHVYGPAARFPFAAERSYTPEDAPVEQLQAVHRLLGVDRVVYVQATVHGYDNRAMLDAVSRSPEKHRGIALLPTDVSSAELQRLHAAGVRGIRYNFARHLGQAPDSEAVLRLADRLAPLGWHLQFYMDAVDLAAHQTFLERLSVPFVIDHFGRVMVDTPADEGSPLHTLLNLLRLPQGWVKISGPERVSQRLSQGEFPYADVVPLAQRLIATAPERILWGSDWPHPNVREMPDDGKLVDLLGRYTEDLQLLRQILVHNPTRLYGQ